ncbi:hypothetical protein D3C85_1397240 [compost metagenome]
MLDASLHDGVFGLDRSHTLNGMRSANGACTCLRETEVQHLALFYKVLDRTRNILYRYVWIDSMLIVEIDTVGAQPLQRALKHLPDMFRAAIECATGIHIETEF